MDIRTNKIVESGIIVIEINLKKLKLTRSLMNCMKKVFNRTNLKSTTVDSFK